MITNNVGFSMKLLALLGTNSFLTHLNDLDEVGAFDFAALHFGFICLTLKLLDFFLLDLGFLVDFVFLPVLSVVLQQ